MMNDKEKIKTGLRKSKVFQGLGDIDLDSLSTICLPKHFDDGVIIIEEGDPKNRDFYILIEGTIAITLEKEGSDIEIARLHAINTIGEMAFVTEQPRSATAISIGETNVIVFPALAVLQFLDKHPPIASMIYKNIIALLSEKLRSSNDLIKNNALTYLDTILAELDL